MAELSVPSICQLTVPDSVARTKPVGVGNLRILAVTH